MTRSVREESISSFIMPPLDGGASGSVIQWGGGGGAAAENLQVPFKGQRAAKELNEGISCHPLTSLTVFITT